MAVNENKTGAVMVVGAGIAGIQASLDLAEMGYYVYLVEKSPAIGGRMAQLDKTFPTNDCSMCIISPKLNDAGGHINVEVITNAEVLEVNGEPGNMTAKVMKKARYVDLTKCTGCAECSKVCPIEVPNEFNMLIDKRKVTYKPYAQAYPNAFAGDQTGPVPVYGDLPGQRQRPWLRVTGRPRSVQGGFGSHHGCPAPAWHSGPGLCASL